MITWRDGLVGFLALAFLSAVSISIAAYIGNVEAGDVLSFEGALVGAAGAVWGALYVEGRKRRLAHLDEQRPILDALHMMTVTMIDVRSKNTIGFQEMERLEKADNMIRAIYDVYKPKSAPTILARENYEGAFNDLFESVFANDAQVNELGEKPISQVTREEMNNLISKLTVLRNAHAKTS